MNVIESSADAPLCLPMIHINVPEIEDYHTDDEDSAASPSGQRSHRAASQGQRSNRGESQGQRSNRGESQGQRSNRGQSQGHTRSHAATRESRGHPRIGTHGSTHQRSNSFGAGQGQGQRSEIKNSPLLGGGTPRVPLALSDVRRTQRRLAALMNKQAVGIVQPKSPRKPLRPPMFHFCMCSRLDPDGRFKDPALNFLRDGLRNVGKDFPDFQYTARRSCMSKKPQTTRSLDETLSTREGSIFAHSVKDLYTGRLSKKGAVSPRDIKDFDYKKLKNVIAPRERLPKISDNQKVIKAPDNTPVGTADERNRFKLPKVISKYESIEETQSQVDKEVTVTTQDSTSEKPEQKTSKPSNVSKNKTKASSKVKSEPVGKKENQDKNDDDKLFKGAIQTKPIEGAKTSEDSSLSKPFDGAIQTKPVTKPPAPVKKMSRPPSSGYGTEPVTDSQGSAKTRQSLAVPKYMATESLTESRPSQSRELSVIGSGQGSRNATMHESTGYSFIRTQATRSTTPSDGGYSFVRDRDDSMSLDMPSFSPASLTRFQAFSPSETSTAAEYNDEDLRNILQHQYTEPSPVDFEGKMQVLDHKFDTGTFDFSSDLNVDDVDTTLRLPKEPTAAPSELPVIEETKPEYLKRAHQPNFPIFPDGVREAYVKALAVAAARHRMPQESWMYGQNISRAFVFSYFDNVLPVHGICPDCDKPVVPGEVQKSTPFRVKKEMKHIFREVEVDDYYPGGKRNPMPRMDWHGHRAKGKKKKQK